MTDQKNLTEFYLRQIRDTAFGIQQKVCEACEISLNPSSAKELVPIPVYEETTSHSLLKAANIRTATEIKWATTHSNEYLPAYFKRYRDPITGWTRNEIVVTSNNYCLARFFAAKELMHCFLDQDNYPATNSSALVHELIDDLVAGGVLLHGHEPQTIVDQMAYAGAFLYMIPDGWVPLLRRVYAEIQAQDPTANANLHLAQLIRVPEFVLRTRLRSVIASSD